MRATFTDEQQSLREVAADLAADARPEHPRAGERIPVADGATRALMDGFAGLGLPEDAGGAGGGVVELAILLHELGRHVVATPFPAHVRAVQLAHAAGVEVAEAAAGRVRWTLATAVGTSPLGPWPASDQPRPRVPHADGADAVVACTGEDDVLVATMTGHDAEEAFDLTEPAATVTLGETSAIGAGATAGMARVLALGAAELVGVGRGAVEMAAAYARERQQFGQPIGRFQGVAHQLADALVAVENAWSLVLYAAWAVDAADADASTAVHAAAASAAEAAVFATERATQVHGGIGITWEAMPHVYLRRAVARATELGEPAWHREQVGRSVLASVG